MTWTFDRPTISSAAASVSRRPAVVAMLNPAANRWAGVEAVADREVRQVAREVADRAKLLEAAAEMASGADRVLDQDRQAGQAESFGGVAQAQRERGDPLVDRTASVTAGMQHEILGADLAARSSSPRKQAIDLAADDGVERRQVDQVVDVDDQRVKVVALAAARSRAICCASQPRACHMRGLAEKIWKVFAPSSTAVSAAVSSEPRVNVWIPSRRGYIVPKRLSLPNNCRMAAGRGGGAVCGRGRDVFPRDRILTEAIGTNVLAMHRPHGFVVHAPAPQLGNSIPHNCYKPSPGAFSL